MASEGLRRTEAKAFFANERTFLHWLAQSVTLGSISAALLGVAGHAHHHWGDEYATRAIAVRVIALIMMALSILIGVHAAVNFHKRGDMLMAKLDGPYDSKWLPLLLSVVIGTSLCVVFVGTVLNYEGLA